MPLSRDEFFSRAKPKSKEAEIPGLGTVAVRQITAREQQAYLEFRNATTPSGEPDNHLRRRAVWWVIAQAVLDREGGGRIFEDGDVDQIGTLEAEAVARVFLEIMRFSDADAEATARAGEASAETTTPASA